MKITFLGTRGYIDIKSRRHKWHTATLITYQKTRLLIDAGIDWLTRLSKLDVTAIAITHAHPDHAWGLQNGSPFPVYATPESWLLMKDYPIEQDLRYTVSPHKKYRIGSLVIEPFFVVHSLRAPAVGYRISGGSKTLFCAHDIISIPQRRRALVDCNLYIGDGASILRPLIRRKNSQIFGHTTIRAQIGWCEKEGVERAVFTHCGSSIVGGDGRTVGALVRRLGREHKVKAVIAYDGMTIQI